MTREIPSQWMPLLEKKGIESYRGLAARADIGVGTVIRLLNGEGSPEPATVAAVALALETEANVVLELAGLAVRYHGPVQWPAEAVFLTPRQRVAVFGVIKSMVEPETTKGTGKSGISLVKDGNVDPDEFDAGQSTGRIAAKKTAKRSGPKS